MLAISLGTYFKYYVMKESSTFLSLSVRSLCSVRGKTGEKKSDTSSEISKPKDTREDLGIESLKNAAPNFSKAEVDQPLNPALAHYGTSLKKTGMKPYSIVKQKLDVKPNVLDEEKIVKVPASKQGLSAEPKNSYIESGQETILQSKEVIADKENLDLSYNEPVDLSQFPKIRAPSIQRIQNLEVPLEWSLINQYWTPSTGFLDSILNYPIDGLKKISPCGRNAEFVDCFATKNKSVKVVPAVTTVLSKTMTPSQARALSLWRKRLIAQIGEDGFIEYRNNMLTRGKQFHDTIQRYLLGESIHSLNIENLPLITNCWKSLIPFLNTIDDVILVESEVLHPRLLYRGIVDCVVEIRGQPFIVEWKHSSRKRLKIEENYDSPIQLMAYKGAINANGSYPFGVANSLLVVAYDDGSPATVFHLGGTEHWRLWLERLHTFWTQHRAANEVAV